MNRRKFLKTATTIALTPVTVHAQKTLTNYKKTQKPLIPTRKLGKTGLDVPVLAWGTVFNTIEKQNVLGKAIELGVRYWDTAPQYFSGKSEIGIGRFFADNPNIRKKIFLATKASSAKSVSDVEQRLQKSLKELNTDYIDLYYGVHAMSKPDKQLNEELGKWATEAKKRRLIRFFGISCHENMDKCLLAAAKAGYVDVVMARYNFRHMQDEKLSQAIQVCYDAGIAIIAMKTQAKKITTAEDKKLTERFTEQSFTPGQAKVKAVLSDKRICTACVGRDNLQHLAENIKAVSDEGQLSNADLRFMKNYAVETCNDYCAGCSGICNSDTEDVPYVSDILRYMMYYNSYGDKSEAKKLFAQLPLSTRTKIINADFRLAERRCPQHIPITKLLVEAAAKLA